MAVSLDRVLNATIGVMHLTFTVAMSKRHLQNAECGVGLQGSPVPMRAAAVAGACPAVSRDRIGTWPGSSTRRQFFMPATLRSPGSARAPSRLRPCPRLRCIPAALPRCRLGCHRGSAARGCRSPTTASPKTSAYRPGHWGEAGGSDGIGVVAQAPVAGAAAADRIQSCV